MKKSKIIKQGVRSIDMFGTPVSIKYKGEETYKTFCGGAVTAVIILFIGILFLVGFSSTVAGEDPTYSTHSVLKSRNRSDALSMTDSAGQLYIGLMERTENLDGSVKETIVPFDPAFLHAKVDYTTNGVLQGRLDLPKCANTGTYEQSITGSASGLTKTDFDNLLCVAPETFFLYNDAEQNLANSVALTFEECGGKYSKDKPLPTDFTQRSNDVQSLLAQQGSDWRLDGCAEDDTLCRAQYWDGSYTRSFESAFLSHFHDYGYQYRETFNSTSLSDALVSSRWTRHKIDAVRYDTLAVSLPLNWTRLYDGRIVAESRVFYANGTTYDLVDGYGIINREDYAIPLETLVQEIKFQEEERSLLDQIPATWIQFANGTVVTDKAYKWYPSGVMTTPNDEVFPERAPNINQFTFGIQEDDGFVNSVLDQTQIPEGYTLRADGALVSPIGLLAYPDGYVATPDGFVASVVKYTYQQFIDLTQDSAKVEFDYQRSWPRPLSTTEDQGSLESIAGTKADDHHSNEWIYSLADDASSPNFFRDWIFHLPKDWTLLPDGRVITGKNVVWFPNGIAEELLELEQGTDFYQRKVSSFTQFFQEETQGAYESIPDEFLLNYNDMSIRSPTGWVYYYPNGLVVTPLGDIWFERVDRNTFFSWFKREAYGSPTINEAQAVDNSGNLMFINMDSGYAWIEIAPNTDQGSTFGNGIVKASQISRQNWSKFFSDPLMVETSALTSSSSFTTVTPSNGQSTVGDDWQVLEKPPNCASRQSLRRFMTDKSIVVYSASAMLEDGADLDSAQTTFLTPVVDKRLELTQFKSVNTMVQEVNTSVRSAFHRILGSTKKEFQTTTTRVSYEDSVTREFIDVESQEVVQTGEPFLKMTIKLDPVVVMNESTTLGLLSLMESLSALIIFLLIVFSPLMSMINGNQYYISLFKNLYWVNETGGDTHDESRMGSPQEYAKQWSKATERFSVSKRDSVLQSPCVRCLTCRRYRQQNQLERILELGLHRVKRQLDVRSLVSSQNILMSFLRLMVSSATNRQLMRVERRHKVLEPNVASDNDSSDGENMIVASREREHRLLETLKEMIEKKNSGSTFTNVKGVDAMTSKLMLQVFRLEKPENRGRVTAEPLSIMPKIKLMENNNDKSVDGDITGMRLSQGRGSVEVFQEHQLDGFRGGQSSGRSEVFPPVSGSLPPPKSSPVVVMQPADDLESPHHPHHQSMPMLSERNHRDEKTSMSKANGLENMIDAETSNNNMVTETQRSFGKEGIDIGMSPRGSRDSSPTSKRLRSSRKLRPDEMEISEAKMVAKAKKWLTGNTGLGQMPGPIVMQPDRKAVASRQTGNRHKSAHSRK